MNFGTISYAATGLAFSLLTALLFSSWRGRVAGRGLVVASGGTALWGFILAWSAFRELPLLLVSLTEILHDGIWLVALIAIGAGAIPRKLALGSVIAWGALLALGLGSPFYLRGEGAAQSLETLITRGGLVASLLGLVMLEQIYRNAEPRARAALKWLIAGIGILLAYDLFLYSQAELLRGLSIDAWNARGLVYAVAVPLLAIAAKRNPEWSLDIFVSRHVVFYTTTVMVVGIYLLLMAIGGYYVRAVGGSWGTVAQIIFWAIGILSLWFLLASEALRWRLRVFISKHFYRNKYDYRIEWLRFIRTLSSTDEGDVRRTALRAVTQIIGSPGGVLLLLDDTGRRFQPAAAWPGSLDSMPEVTPILSDSELSTFLADRQWIIDVDEYRRSPEVYRHVDLPEWVRLDPALRIIAPMLELDRLVGIFAFHSPPRPFELTFEDRDLLKTVSQHVATQIAQQDADRRLAESRQFEAYNRLTAFMMHDLKNSVAQLKLIVANAERHKRNPEFVDDVVSTIANTVKRMNGLIDQLRGAGSAEVRVAALDELLAAAVHRCGDRLPKVLMELPGQTVWVRADTDRLGAVIEHVLRNAQDATPETGRVRATLDTRDGQANLVILDDGVGMAPEFVRDRLFRPFDSTKGAKGMGIGAYQSREYVRMLGGDVEVQSSPGKGTSFSIRLPLSAAPTPYKTETGVAVDNAG